MQITVEEFKSKLELSKEEAINSIIKKYHLENVKCATLIRKALDSRDKTNILYIYNAVFELDRINKKYLDKHVKINTEFKDYLDIPKLDGKERPIVIGFGPAGMFSALVLAEANLKPIIFERGYDIDKRTEDVNTFFNSDKFNTESNVCFGEGGAGSFSDGKLNTNLSDPKIRYILKKYHEFGANENIIYDSHPHIGTDKLKDVCRNLRKYLISLGAEIHFGALVTECNEDSITVIEDGKTNVYKSNHIVLGIGHSARPTYEMLLKKGFMMEPKPFSIGCRIEHPQALINKLQYGNANISSPAIYKINYHMENRDIYTFCMCPGGYVISSNSEEFEVVTNGMSESMRDGVNANSALLINVKVEDFYKTSPLDGLYFVKKIEEGAYKVSNSYKVPCNLVKEFVNNEVASDFRTVKPTYPNGSVFADFSTFMPKFIVDGLKEGIVMLDKRIKGFNYADAILSAPETRSSSPVRITRDNLTMKSLTKPNYYPVGEGAGYAGGITSSALDGLKAAFKIIEEMK